MKYTKIIVLLFIFLLSSCTTNTVPDEVDCDLFPTHEDCLPDEVDCTVTPEHEDCEVPPVDCTVTPDHEDCVVDCEATPNHEDCIVDCEVTPEHEDCVVDCEVTPEHEDCVVDCEVTPEHEDCEAVVVDCEMYPFHVDCIDEDEYESCEIREIENCVFIFAFAYNNGEFDEIATYEKLKHAEAALEDSDNLAHVVLWNDKVVNMKQGVINFKTKSSSQITELFPPDLYIKTYLNGHYNVDGAFISSEGFVVTGMIAGLKFEVNFSDVELIPHNQNDVGYSYYMVNSHGELNHYILQDLHTGGYWSTGPFGPAPDYLVQGVKYYSYDGHYFFDDVEEMLLDYRLDITVHAVNEEEPYYNYYQYLSFRTKTNYTGEELTEYINGRTISSNILQDSGSQFYAAQEEVFINAALEIAFAVHESGWGTSQIARQKLNLFGMNAVDSDPFNEATGFESIQECVEYHSRHYLQSRYLNPDNWVSHGTNVGDKYQGLNFKYASDAYWGEKIAKHYYQLDKALGLKDFNAYKIILLDEDALGYLEADVLSEIIYNTSDYTYKGLRVPLVVLGETENFYIVQSPLAFDENNHMTIDDYPDETDVIYIPKISATEIN